MSSRFKNRPGKRVRVVALVVALVALLVLTAGVVGTALADRTPPALSDPSIQAKADAGAAKWAAEKAAAERAKLERDTAKVSATGRPVEALILGDSLARGSAATTPKNSFTALTEAALDRVGPMNVTTIAKGAGSGGLRVADITPQIPQDKTFDLVIVELGTNDAVTPDVAAFKSDYAALVQAVRAVSPKSALVCLGPWGAKDKTAEFDSVIQPLCEAGNLGRFRSTSALFGDEKNRWVDGLMPDGTKVDNFHPSDNGHKAIAKLIMSAIRFS